MLAGDSNSNESCRTFVFRGETHTLGNALKNVILRNPQVIFCGYSMPHPAEDQVKISIAILRLFVPSFCTLLDDSSYPNCKRGDCN